MGKCVDLNQRFLEQYNFPVVKPSLKSDDSNQVKKPQQYLKRPKKSKYVNPNQGYLEQHNFYSVKSSLKAKAQARLRHENYAESARLACDPVVGIVYRKCKDGEGAFFDNYALQKASGGGTLIIRDESVSTQGLLKQIRYVTHRLPYTPKNLTEIDSNADDFGLLYIPGLARSFYESQDYINNIKKDRERVIKQAKLEGRPILAICAGCWLLWESFNYITSDGRTCPGEVREVREHNYRQGMPTFKDTTGKIGKNKQIHRIKFEEKSQVLLAASRFERSELPVVNSVHWKAVSEVNVPFLLDISAKSVSDQALAPINPHTKPDEEKRPMDPEECVEAFESKYGAPILGIQWHPEAYMKNKDTEFKPENHEGIIKYMKEAGRVFMLKKRFIVELKDRISEVSSQNYDHSFNLKRVEPIALDINITRRLKLKRSYKRRITLDPSTGCRTLSCFEGFKKESDQC